MLHSFVDSSNMLITSIIRVVRVLNQLEGRGKYLDRVYLDRDVLLYCWNISFVLVESEFHSRSWKSFPRNFAHYGRCFFRSPITVAWRWTMANVCEVEKNEKLRSWRVGPLILIKFIVVARSKILHDRLVTKT